MDSTEAAQSPQLSDSSSSLSGSSPIKTPSSTDSDSTPNVVQTNSLNTISNKTSSGGDGGSSSASDDGGFVSGEEDFETAPVEETLVENGNEGEEDSNESFLDTSEFPMTPKVELPIVVDDNVEKVSVFEGEEVVEGEFGSGSNVVDVPEVLDEKPELVEKLNLNEVVKEDEVLEGSKGDKVGESSELPEEKKVEEIESVADEKTESLNGENLVTASEALSSDDFNLDNDAKLTTEGDSVVEAIQVDMPAPGVAVCGNMEEDEVNENKGLTDGSDQTSHIVEPAETETELVDEGAVKLTSEGDSVVEAIDVDMPAPGVVVVGDVEEKEEADGNVALIDGPDQTSNVVEPAESKLVDENVLKLTSEGDSVVEVIDVVDMPVPGVAVVGKMEEGVDAGEIVAMVNRSSETDRIVEEVVDKEVVGVTGGKFEALDVEAFSGDNVIEEIQQDVEASASTEKSEALDLGKNEKNPDAEIEKGVDYEAKENGVKVVSDGDTVGSEGDKIQAMDFVAKSLPNDPPADAEKHIDSDSAISGRVKEDGLENGLSDKFILEESAEVEAKDDADEGYSDDSASEGDTNGMIFGSSEAAKMFIEELERGTGGGSHSGGESSQDHSQMIDGQIATDSDEEGEDGKELFDSAALTALLKAAADGGSEGGNITITSQDGSRLFSVERPAGLGSSLQSLRPGPRPTRSNFFTSSNLVSGGESDNNLSEEERKKLEKLQSIRVRFLRLVQRLGLSPDESVAAQVLYRLALVAGRQMGQSFGLDDAKRKALKLEAEGKVDLDFSVNILVLGKSGVGKSATINSIFGEEKSVINAFQPATTTIKEISGMVDGVKVRVFDTPGLKPSVMDQGFNQSVLSSAKKLTKKNPPDIVLYVDRLDVQTRDLNDLSLLKTVTSSLGPSIWRSAIVTLTHAASAPPDGPSGSPLSYEVFVTQRSHVVQQGIGQAVGDLRMMSPSLMNPVSLVENHPSCRKNREGQKVLPNGQTWRPQLLLLCYSMKILSEANSLSKAQDPFDHRKLFGFRARSPPLPYMLSSMLQSRPHPKLSSEQGGDNGDSDVDLADLSDSDQEEDEDEYDQLPPFKPLKKSQLSKLSKEQRNAYFEEYDYRVKLLQKKQWKEELKRMREMKKKGKDAAVNDYAAYMDEEGDSGTPAPVAVPLPDMVLPPSFDSDNPAYRFRFLEPTSQFLARPVLDTHGWDHDCGYDGVNLEQSLAIASQFPAVVSVQVTKDKKDFSINLDSSVSAKHGENGSSMAGFDIQPIGKQLAYIVRGETKFKNLKKNKTAAGISVTFLGENVVTGFKVEDHMAFGKQYSLAGSAGTVRFLNDSAYGANVEVQRRELDYPIGQVQSTFGLSIIRWRGDLALGFNSLAQFSVGRGSKVAVRAGINNKMSGQITIRTSSSDHLSLALAAVIPTAISIYKKLCPDVGEKYSIY